MSTLYWNALTLLKRWICSKLGHKDEWITTPSQHTSITYCRRCRRTV